ncbi:olfactory receptor 14A16-like, partial [Terrapene carolina triunguis]|uniref:olfactory receptor 14A16-like n=1 Tax=Terrapene triunguis TaxID=2587831 RepID=UPI00115687A4
ATQNIKMKEMANGISVTQFLLLGFSNIQELQILNFVVFLVIYLGALLRNLLIIMVIALHHHLHIPIYFFLVNLSFLDLCYISVTVPKSLVNSLTNCSSISFLGCFTQVFLIIAFMGAELAFLTIMAYDRYLAICNPLCYGAIMSTGKCTQMALCTQCCTLSYLSKITVITVSVSIGLCCFAFIVVSYFHIFATVLRIPSMQGKSEVFCTCLPHLMVVILFLGASTFAYMGPASAATSAQELLVAVFYSVIFKTVLRIPSEQGQHKAFFTCLPHLTVVTLLVCTASFAYMKPTSSSASGLDLMVGVLYSVVPPMMNPIIYSMRNKEIKVALKKLIVWRLFTKS